MKVKMKDEFEVEIVDGVTDDWEFLEVLANIDEGETGQIVRAAKMLLGNDGVKALKDHLRDEDGRVRTSAMVGAISEIMDSAGELKNSEPSPA